MAIGSNGGIEWGMDLRGRLIFGSCLFVAGLVALLLWITPKIDKFNASKEWPNANGEVISAVIRGGHLGSDNEFLPIVTYQYTVNEKIFSSQRLTFNDQNHTSLRSEAKRRLKQYPIGSKVQVFYDPEDPAEAVLQTGVPLSFYMYRVVMWLILLGGVVTLLGVLRCKIKGNRSIDNVNVDEKLPL